jgi:hypothetical protein
MADKVRCHRGAVEILLARLAIEISGSVLTQRAWKGINKNGNVPVCPGFIFAKFTLDIDK